MTDPVLDTLFLPLEDGLIDWPATGPALFLRARTGDALDEVSRDKLLCEQSFKPAYDALIRAGFRMREDAAPAGLTLVLPPRQREEYRALLARAVSETTPGGIVMAAVSNNEGAKTVENDLKALTGNISSQSKNKCRVFWATVDGRIDQALLAEWTQLDAPREIDSGFTSRPGLFAWDHIDAGSKLLADHLPALKGKVADLGAGFGYLSDAVLTKNPGLTRLDAIEAEGRAVEMARLNLAKHGDRATVHWLDATKALPDTYDAIISNPPFHVTDRADRHDVGKAFITSAARSLTSGGQLWIVANRHLPYEETLEASFKHVNLVAQNNFYKVFKAVGPKGKTK
ncbi:MAG: class I SAM-dependent methyltransferase [Asticcacaulis sp.]|uniref:class I SAM-dependent methyltransferase n=1 Tax=Asticcacaulis sp. TaxID=1872648 RepID=UPI0039E696AA